MPTAGRLFGGILLAALGWFAATLAVPLLPDGMPAPRLPLTTAALGFLMGWIVVGSRVGLGWRSGIGAGITGVAATVFWVLLLNAGGIMLAESLRRRYDGPGEAVIAVFGYMIDFGRLLLTPDLLIVMGVGAVVAGLVAEWAGQRFR